MIGAKLAHYEIVRKLGSGGMGDVYAALDTKLRREVALKVLPADVAEDEERRLRFEREARTAAALNHPNIVTLYAVEQDAGECFLTMELVEGDPLSKGIPEGGFGCDELLRLAVPLADAVATAHEAGIIHRDLKPANVMVAADGVVKVLDFGLAKLEPVEEAVPSEEMATETAGVLTTGEGRVLGTPAYMSPEQAEGKKLDPRTDIFSLGVVLYELSTGRRPFEGDTAMSTISAVLKDTPPSITELREELPPRLGRIIARCLVKDRRRRYQTARDLASDLQDLCEEGKEASTASLAATTRVPTAEPRRARRVIVGAAALLGASALVATGYLARRATEPSRAAPPVPASTTRSSGGPEVRRFVRLTSEYGVELGPQIAPDGKWFVYAAGPKGNLDIYRQRVGGKNRTNLTDTSAVDDWQPAISADGERLAFRSDRGGGGIFVMGATGESVRRVTDYGHHPAWSPDGKRLSVSATAILNPKSRGAKTDGWIVDVESGERTKTQLGDDAVQGTWSPQGHRLAVCGRRNSAEYGLFALNQHGAEPEMLLDGAKPTRRLVWTPWWAPDGESIYFSSDASGVMNIWRVPIGSPDGGAKSEPTPVTAGVNGSAAYPSLSHDGRRLVFSVSSTTGNIARVRFDPKTGRVSGQPEMITRGANGFAAPDVSPDGAWVTFGSYAVRHDTDENIYIARTDGSEVRALTSDVGKLNRLPRWTADGARIIFYSNRSGDYDVWSVAPDGSERRKLTETPGEATLYAIPAPSGSRVIAIINQGGLIEFDTAKPFDRKTVKAIPRCPGDDCQFWPIDWSPDGEQLAGVVEDAGSFRGVYTHALSKGAYEKIVETGQDPRWLRDGKRLIYTADEDYRVWTVTLSDKQKLDAGFQLTEDRMYSVAPDEVGHLALSPDEDWLYFSRMTEDGDVWLAELE